MDVEARVAVVTGGASGIGRATAIRLARDGAPVVVADVDDAGAAATVRIIEEAGGRAAAVHADVASDRDACAMIAFAEERFGRVDILVNNAGVVEALTTQRQTFPEVAPERWMRMLDINLRGVILGTQFAIDAMRRDGGGAIVNVASGAGIGFAAHDAPVYAASKAAVARFSAALGWAHARYGVRVNCICPGWVDTPMSQRGRAEMTPEEIAANVPSVIAAPEEIADAVVAFVRDDALAGRVMLCYEGAPWRLLRGGDDGRIDADEVYATP